jgi:hypothetical protein
MHIKMEWIELAKDNIMRGVLVLHKKSHYKSGTKNLTLLP